MLVLKTLHVLGATLFLGTGLGSAWYKLRAWRSGDVRIIAWTDREVVLADWVFTIPSGVLMPVTGLWLAHLYGMPWTTGWLKWAIGGYACAGLFWLPAAWLQLRMRRMSTLAAATGAPLPPEWRAAHLAWMLLGVPSFLATLVTVWVMVTKQPLF
ncbi:MAG: DUF2269 domain-containing protein [Myxococcales bacterium]|nr:DUF2269 domain-containing protein [Myxococcales bacterium]